MPVVIRRDRPDGEPREPEVAAAPAPEGDSLEIDPELVMPPEWTTRADRRTTRDKFTAGLRGLKIAVRGDSSFFVHAYRALLIILTGTLLRIGPSGWCLLLIAAGLVLVAELAHSAIDTLARAVGDPEEQALKAAREIAAAGVLVAVSFTAVVTTILFTIRFGQLLQGL